MIITVVPRGRSSLATIPSDTYSPDAVYPWSQYAVTVIVRHSAKHVDILKANKNMMVRITLRVISKKKKIIYKGVAFYHPYIFPNMMGKLDVFTLLLIVVFYATKQLAEVFLTAIERYDRHDDHDGYEQ